MTARDYVLLALMSSLIACWYTFSLVALLQSQPTRALSESSESLLRALTSIVFAAALLSNLLWTFDHLNGQAASRCRRTSTVSDWRTSVLLRLALAISGISLAVIGLFTDSDSAMFEWRVADRLLLTPITAYQTLLYPTILAPLYFFMLVFVGIARTNTRCP